MQPLDGGKLLSILLEAFFGQKGVRLSYLLGCIFAILFVILFLATYNIIGAALFVMFAFESYKGFKATKGLLAQEDTQDVHKIIALLEDKFRQGNAEEAVKGMQDLIATIPESELYFQIVGRLTEHLLEKGEYEKIYTLLNPLQKKLSVDLLEVLQLSAYKMKNYKEALVIGKIAFQEEPTFDTARLNAYAAASLNEVESALNWLRALYRLPRNVSLQEVLSSEELNGIRQNPTFIKFQSTIQEF